MSKFYKYLGYILILNVETIIIILFCWYLGEYLNNNYYMGFSWTKILVVLSFVLILFLWIKIIKQIIKTDYKINKKR